MKKNYIAPVSEIFLIKTADVILSSGAGNEPFDSKDDVVGSDLQW